MVTYIKRKYNTGFAWEPMERKENTGVAWEPIENVRKTQVLRGRACVHMRVPLIRDLCACVRACMRAHLCFVSARVRAFVCASM